jgi:hypothetical protein
MDCKKLIAGVIILISCIARSQPFYITMQAGYHLPVASENLLSKVDQGSKVTTQTVVRGSLGEGLNLSADVGYKFLENAAVEIKATHVRSRPYEGYYRKDTSFSHSIALSSSIWNLSPIIRISFSDQLSSFYTKCGPVFRIGGKMIIDNKVVDHSLNRVTHSTWIYNKGFSAGAFFAFGYELNFGTRWKLHAEAQVTVQSWAPTHGKVIKYTVNGVSTFETLNVSQKELLFVSTLTEDQRRNSGWEPSRQLKQNYPYSSAGVVCGLSYKLGSQ